MERIINRWINKSGLKRLRALKKEKELLQKQIAILQVKERCIDVLIEKEQQLRLWVIRNKERVNELR